jgi:hypothetical protein
MLRDVYGFPVCEGGHIDAMAFSPTEIGESRYRSAQASLRRACDRLASRDLIQRYAGQSHDATEISFYERSRIGLTEAGVAVADNLIALEQPMALAA